MSDEYPDLSKAEGAIDLETKDPNLKTKGSGWATFDGHIVGFAVLHTINNGIFLLVMMQVATWM